MPKHVYTLFSQGDVENISVLVPGRAELLGTDNSHPNWAAIKKAAEEGLDVDFPALFDSGVAIAQRFERLTTRITHGHGTILLDGDPIHNSLTQQILRFMDEGLDFNPLVAFMDKVVNNPCEHSREQLYDWLENREGITISPIGNVVGYKGVHKLPDGSLVSGFSGTAIVDGQEVTGQIPNKPGSTIEMPRSEVEHNPSASCSRGLHVGTYTYARNYAQGAMLECHVDPRDVVSVPTDANGEKVRVCRYLIAGTIDTPYKSALLEVDGYEPSESQYESYECELCGEDEDECWCYE